MRNLCRLNNDREKKLYELCAEFFKEYKIIKLNYKNEWAGIVMFQREASNVQELIHWYHLCYTDLAERIDYKINHNKQPELFDIVYNNLESLLSAMLKYHPVDFLYNYVQHCKSKKYFK